MIVFCKTITSILPAGTLPRCLNATSCYAVSYSRENAMWQGTESAHERLQPSAWQPAIMCEPGSRPFLSQATRWDPSPNHYLRYNLIKTHLCHVQPCHGGMASPTQWTWVWANSRRWLRTGKPGVPQSIGSQSQIWLSDWTTMSF